jgi:hypothetical protein
VISRLSGNFSGNYLLFSPPIKVLSSSV